MRKKYLTETRARCIEVIPIHHNASPIWKLCQNTTFIIQDDLRWSTGNGKKIRIWEDSVGNAQQRDSLVDLKRWMDCQNLSTISDISNWHNSGRWIGWRHLETLYRLKKNYSLLQTLLRGSLTFHTILSNYRSWENFGVYTVKAGYNTVHNNDSK